MYERKDNRLRQTAAGSRENSKYRKTKMFYKDRTLKNAVPVQVSSRK